MGLSLVSIAALIALAICLWSRKQILAAWKKDSERLRNGERYRVLFDQSPKPMYVFNLQTLSFVDVNQAALRHYGYTREEFLSLSADGIRPPEELSLLLDRVNTGVQTPCLTRHLKKDGSVIDVEVSVHHLTVDNLPMVLVVVNDVTEQKRAEENLRQAHLNLAESVSELQQRESDLKQLGVLGEMLQACHTSPEACSMVAEFLPEIFPEYSGGLYAIKQSRDVVEPVATWRDSRLNEVFFPPEDCWALRRGGIHVMDGRGPRCKHSSADAASMMCIPMMAEGDAIGVLHLIPDEGRGENGNSSIPLPLQYLAKAAADQIALALSNIRYREVLQSQSIRDPLTTLFNRRYMEESLQRELHHAKRMGTAVAVIMLDIDNFKMFNDVYGHRAADSMLRLFGTYLQKSVRLDDIVCRYGGEEFVLILPATELDDAMKRIDEAREGARRLAVETELETSGQLTFSAGIALFPIHGMDSETLLSAADRALYKAKHTGRDRVSVAVEV